MSVVDTPVATYKLQSTKWLIQYPTTSIGVPDGAIGTTIAFINQRRRSSRAKAVK